MTAMQNTAIAAQQTSTGIPAHHSGNEPCAGWGRVSNPQEDCPGITERGCRAQSSTMTPDKTRTVGHLLPQSTIDVTAGWAAFPIDTRPPGSQYTAG